MTTPVKLAYGHKHLVLDLPAGNLLGVFAPPSQFEGDDEAAIVQRALANPVHCLPLHDLVRPGQRVVVVTSDLTRPCPSDRLLPRLLDELSDAGVPDANVTVVAALGLHRPMTEEELTKMASPGVYRRVRVINHDPRDTVRLGITSRGTPVELFRPVVEADARVCLGNLEFHYFAGYSGGAKAILPGCASRLTVRANHAHIVQPTAVAGRLEENPIRRDLEEGAAMVGVDFVLNVLVDEEHRIVGAVAGDVHAAHRQGCKLVAQRGIVPVPRLADIVLVSVGGYPKDINLYQAQKGLDNAAHAVRTGGIIILVAECAEGLGNRIFEEWMTRGEPVDDILRRIKQEFVLGGHKAAAIAKQAQKARIFLVSHTLQGVALTGMEHHATVETALEAAFESLGTDARVAVLPQGGSVLPVPAGGRS